MVIMDYKLPLQMRVTRNVDKGVCGGEYRPSQGGPRAASSSFPRSVGFTEEQFRAWCERMSCSDRRICLDA